jgi:hypothetical protein
MSRFGIHFESCLVTEYEALRTKSISAGNSYQLSGSDRLISSGGLFQWALGKQLTQQKSSVKSSVAPKMEVCEPCADNADHFDDGVISLIAAMTIQSIALCQSVRQ